MRSIAPLVALLFPILALADPGPVATVPVMDALADLRSGGDGYGWAPDGVEVDPATAQPVLRIQAKGAMDVGPLLDLPAATPFAVKAVRSGHESGYEVDLGVDLTDPDAWLDLALALELLAFDAQVTVGVVHSGQPGSHRAFGEIIGRLEECREQQECLGELRRDAPWLDPWSATVAIELEIHDVDEEDPRVSELVERDWVEPPSILQIMPTDGAPAAARIIGRLPLARLDGLDGVQGLLSRPLEELSPTALQLDVVDAAADVAACGLEPACLHAVGDLHDAIVSPDGHLGVLLQGHVPQLDEEQPGWLFAPDSLDGHSGLITFEALRDLGLGRWRTDGQVLVSLERDDPTDDRTEEDWHQDWHADHFGYDPSRGEAPGAPAPTQERPFGLQDDRLAGWLADLFPGLDGASPGSEVGLKMRWSSLSPATLDGELVDTLLPGAAGSETVVAGRYRHVLHLAVPTSTVDPGLSLVFSRGTDRGYLGLHWSLSTSAITRRGPLGGFATGTDDDRFFLDGRELLPLAMSAGVPGLQQYAFEDGGSEGVIHDASTGGWTVTLGGATQEYGGVDGCDGRDFGVVVHEDGSPYAPTEAQAWRLCRTKDDRGNALLYQYDVLDRLDRVAWGEAGAAPDPDLPADQRTHQLVLDYSTARPDPLLVADVEGMVVHDTLLSSVSHLVSPTGQSHEVERSWEFVYTRALPAGRTLLEEVWLHSDPDADRPASQRLRQFHYRNEHGEGDFDGAAVRWEAEIDLSAWFKATEDWRMRIVRANHDALPDVLFLDVADAWKSSNPPVCQEECAEPAQDPCLATSTGINCVQPGDSDYDDVCVYPVEVRLFVNTGGLQFVEDPVATQVIQTWVNQQFFDHDSADAFVAALSTVDLNGDGMDDLVGPTTTLLSPDAADWRALEYQVHQAGGLQTIPWDLSETHPIWVDVDGDGRVDLVESPVADETADIAGDGYAPGGLCIAPENSLGGLFGARLNRTEGNQLEFTVDPMALRVPFFYEGPLWDQVIHENLAAPIAPAPSDSPQIWGNDLLACDMPDGRTGYLITADVLATLDFDEAGIAAATSGWGYLAQHLQFTDATADGCVDVVVSMETHPLKAISALASSWPGYEAVPDYFSGIFAGDCRGSFTHLDAHLGWPSLRTRSRGWSDAHVSCGSAPFNGIALSQACGETSLQPWALRECQPYPSCDTCCGSCGGYYASCESFDCSPCTGAPPPEEPDEGDLEDLTPPEDFVFPPVYEPQSSEPACSTSTDPWISDSQVEPWDPMLRHRFVRGDGDRRAGGSLSSTVGGQLVDLDGDGRPEWLQACSRRGFVDPMSPGWVAPDSDKVHITGQAAGYPLAIHFPASSGEWMAPGLSCDQAAARASGIEFAGLIQGNSTTRSPWLFRDPASVLADMDGDGFADQLITDGGGGISVRPQARQAPENSLESVTWPYGEHPDGSSFLTWRAGDPLESPNLPFADVGIAEIVDVNGHRVWARAQCRMERGQYVGCGIVAHQDHRGAFTKSLFATRAELPGRSWLGATWDADGQLATVGVTLPSAADLSGLDEVEPFYNPAWRDCSFALGNGTFDGSLLSYVQECLFHSSPWMGSGLDSSVELWSTVGQVASAWPYVDGMLGHGVELLGGPSSLAPGFPGPHEMFVQGSVHDPGLQVPTRTFAEGYTSTIDDDLETEQAWWSVGGQARLQARVLRSPATGEVFGHSEFGYDGWLRTSTTSWGGSDSIVTRRTLDAFGRTETSTDAAGETSTVTWNACGRDVATDPLGNSNQEIRDALCRLERSVGSSGGNETIVRDGLGAAVERIRDPDTADPSLHTFHTVDREPDHFGDPTRPQSSRSDGRSLDLTFRDSKGHVVLQRSCQLAGDPADSSTWSCAPGTEVDRRLVFTEDGAVYASSSPHPPGEPATWMTTEQDSLGRSTVERPVLGTYDQLLGLAPGLELGPAVYHFYDYDRTMTIGPTGLERVSIRAPLQRTELLNGDVVSERFIAPDGAMLSTVDVMGRTADFTYDAFRRRVQSSGPNFFGVDPSGVEVVIDPITTTNYDAAGRPSSVVDPTGALWSVTYDPAGRPASLFAPDGGVLSTFVYDDPNRSTTILDADGDPILQTTDALGRTVAIDAPDGVATVSWDAFGGVAHRNDRRGSSTTTSQSWLGGGRVRSTMTLDDGSEVVAFADLRGRLLRTVDRDEVGRDFEYDDWGRLVRLRLGAASPRDISTWPDGELLFEQGHDAFGRISWRCPAGISSGLLCEGLEYDERGRVVVAHTGLQPVHLDSPASWVSMGVSDFDWRDDGSPDWQLDPLGQLTEYFYDDAGHPIEVLVDGQTLGTTVYDAGSRPVREYHPDGSLTERVLDDRGRPIEQWLPGRSVPTTFGYWPDGALQWVEDGDGMANVIEGVPVDRWMDYDEAGRLVQQISWNDAVVQFEYDGADLFAKTAIDPTEGVASRTEFVWDPTDPRLVQTTTALTTSCASDGVAAESLSICPQDEVAVTKTAYTPGGRRSTFTDGEGHTTQWVWDPLTGRLASELHESTERHLEYGVGGLVSREIQGSPAAPRLLQDLSYDPLGRLVEQVWKDKSTGDAFVVNQAHDLLGRIVWTEAKQNGAITEETYRDYDALGRPVQLGRNLAGTPPVAVPFNGSCDVGELCFDFDAAHRLERTTYPDQRAVSYEYSGPLLDRVCEGPSCGAGQTIHEVITRDVLGRATETWRTGDIYETTTFDGGGQPDLQQIEYLNPVGAPSSGAALVLVDPEYDVFGRQVGRIVDHVGKGPFSEFDESWSWTYDAAGRLSSETMDKTTTLFEWDRAGNRLSSLDADTGEGMFAAFGLDNRLEQVVRVDDVGAQVSNTTFSYDDLGRRLDDEDGNALFYSPHGRLAAVLDASGATLAEWSFGSNGRRLVEETSAGKRTLQFGPGSLHPYVVDENGDVQDVVQVGGAPIATLKATPGPDKLTTIQSALSGSTSLTADVTGEITWQGSWDAWGQPTRAEGTPPAVGWRGLQPSGPDVPYLAAAFRDYDPTTGTWLQQDPLGVDGGTNIYGYAEGDPVNLSDPLGLCVRKLTLEARAERAGEMFEAVLDGGSGGEAGLGSRKGNYFIPLLKHGTCGQRCFEGLVVQAIQMKGAKAAAERAAAEAQAQAQQDAKKEAIEDRAEEIAGEMLADAELDRMYEEDPQAYQDLLGAVSETAVTLALYEAASAAAGQPTGGDLAQVYAVYSGLGLTELFTSSYEAGLLEPSHAAFVDFKGDPIQLAVNGGGGPDPATDALSGFRVTRYDMDPVKIEALARKRESLYDYAWENRHSFGEPVPVNADGQGLEAFALAYHMGDALWFNDDWRDYGFTEKPAYHDFAQAHATVERNMRTRKASAETIIEGTPAAVGASGLDMVSGLSGLLSELSSGPGKQLLFGAISYGTAEGADWLLEANFGLTGFDPRDAEVHGDIVFMIVTTAAGEAVAASRFGRAAGWTDDLGRPSTWNEFQSATRGVFSGRGEAAEAWGIYKELVGIGKPARSLTGPGQYHHLLSSKVVTALNKHPTLRGVFQRQDPGLIKQAVNLKAHHGYETWHRNLDGSIEAWVNSHQTATPEQFIQYLDSVYASDDLVARFGAMDLSTAFGLQP